MVVCYHLDIYEVRADEHGCMNSKILVEGLGPGRTRLGLNDLDQDYKT